MSDKDNRNTLLPSGFQDVMPPYAGQERKIIQNLLDFFEDAEYLQVKPPMAEFEDNSMQNQDDIDNSFRILDPASQNTMLIRSDMTPQISRLASLRMKDIPRPLRLSYAGNILRVSGKGLYQERQLTQAGIEVIGINEADNSGEVEIIKLAIKSLQGLDIKDLTVDFCLPKLIDIILSDANTPANVGAEIKQALATKDEAKLLDIAKSGEASAEIFIELMKFNGDISQLENVANDLKLNNIANGLIAEFIKVVGDATKILPDISVTIDLMDSKRFEYYTGTAFSIFSASSNEEIGRGGRYKTLYGAEESSGFTLLVNAVQRILEPI